MQGTDSVQMGGSGAGITHANQFMVLIGSTRSRAIVFFTNGEGSARVG